MKYVLTCICLMILSGCYSSIDNNIGVHYEIMINNHLIVCEKEYRTTSGAILAECEDIESGRHGSDIQMATNYIITPKKH